MNTIIIEKILEGIVPGIVSGLVTSIIVLIFVLYWTAVIKPFLEKLVYHGVRIDQNKWKVHVVNTNADTDTAEITFSQSAHRISGKISWYTDGIIIEYELQGEFSDLILTATYKQINAVTLDRGAITLLYEHNGQELNGCYAWYDDITNKIISGTYRDAIRSSVVAPKRLTAPSR